MDLYVDCLARYIHSRTFRLSFTCVPYVKISYRSRNRVTAQRNIEIQHRDKHAHLLPLHPPSRCRNNPPKTMTGQRAAFANIFGVIDDVIPSVSCSLDFKYRNSFLVPTASSCRLLITCVRECAAAACGINNIA